MYLSWFKIVLTRLKFACWENENVHIRLAGEAGRRGIVRGIHNFRLCVCRPSTSSVRIEKASGEKVTNLSRCLRRCLAKLRLGFEDGHPYYKKVTVPNTYTTINEELGKQSKLASKRRVAKCQRDTYRETPYKGMGEFVSDVASLVRCFPRQMKNRIKGESTILANLWKTTKPASLEYLANFARFAARNPEIQVQHGAHRKFPSTPLRTPCG